MEWVNAAYKWENIPRGHVQQFILLLSPFAPHLAEEIWFKLGHVDSLAYEEWPKWDEQMTLTKSQTISIQVNGKMRGTVDVPLDCGEEDVYRIAIEKASIAKFLEGQAIVKRIFVPGKMLSIVVKPNS